LERFLIIEDPDDADEIEGAEDNDDVEKTSMETRLAFAFPTL
jgi:hypothetical protein